MNSTSFQPTPIPSRNRPPHSTSSEAACFATSTRLTLRQDQHTHREADLPRVAGQKPE